MKKEDDQLMHTSHCKPKITQIIRNADNIIFCAAAYHSAS